MAMHEKNVSFFMQQAKVSIFLGAIEVEVVDMYNTEVQPSSWWKGKCSI
jgi:hypothetical protein